MPLYLFYAMVQKSQKWPKTQIKGGGGSCLKAGPPWFEFLVIFDFFAPWYRKSR